MVAHTYNPSTLGGWGRILELRSSKPTWAIHWDTLCTKKYIYIYFKNLLGLVAHSYSPSYLEGWDRRMAWAQEFKTSLGNTVRPHLYQKKRKNELDVVAHACGPSYSGGWGRRIAWAWEIVAVVSRDHATALQPGWQSKTLSQKKKW